MSPLQRTATNDRRHSALSPRMEVLFFFNTEWAIVVAFPEAKGGNIQDRAHVRFSVICGLLCATVLRAVLFRIIGALVAQVR